MIRKLIVVVALCALACGKKEASAPPPAATPTTNTATAAAPAQSASAPNGEPDLLAIAAGALVAQKPSELNDAYGAYRMLDEAPDRGWSTPENDVAPQTIVIALPERTQLSRLEFDTAGVDGDDGRAAKDITVEMSDASATSGFQKVADVSLAEHTDHQSFAVTGAPGRWLRLNVKNNHGSKSYIELMEVRGFGKQLTRTPFPPVSGTYQTNNGDLHLKQDGTSVSGCYGTAGGLINGGIDGRVMKLTWREGSGDAGTAVLVFSADGKELFGFTWNDGEDLGAGRVWDGTKQSADIGGCANWSGGSAPDPMAAELESAGRTRVYGINFDTDSATIRPESKPTLDKLVAILKAKPEWSLTIEGHTDSTGDDAHNQQLSEQRAESVKQYLAGAGIDAARLSTQGFGATHPVAKNETELGRAQNRRVELVRAGQS